MVDNNLTASTRDAQQLDDCGLTDDGLVVFAKGVVRHITFDGDLPVHIDDVTHTMANYGVSSTVARDIVHDLRDAGLLLRGELGLVCADDRELPSQTARRTGEYRISECEGCRRMRPQSAGKCECGHGSSLCHNVCPECGTEDAVRESCGQDYGTTLTPICESCDWRGEQRNVGGLR